MTGSVPRNGLLTTSCAGTFSFHLGHSATKETSGLADFPEAPSSPAEMVSGGKMPPHKQRSSGPRAGVQPLPLPPCPTVFSRGGVQLYPTARSHLPPLLASRAAAFRYLVEAPEHLMPGCRPLPPGTPHPTPRSSWPHFSTDDTHWPAASSPVAFLFPSGPSVGFGISPSG